jgi:hypothetical protein
VSTSAITTWAAVVAGAAVLLLVALDRRKPARHHRVTPRGVIPGRAPSVRTVTQEPVVTYRGTPWWRRILSFGELGALSLVLGALLAIGVGGLVFGAFWVLTNAVR